MKIPAPGTREDKMAVEENARNSQAVSKWKI
jgi:hypothetical protein